MGRKRHTPPLEDVSPSTSRRTYLPRTCIVMTTAVPGNKKGGHEFFANAPCLELDIGRVGEGSPIKLSSSTEPCRSNMSTSEVCTSPPTMGRWPNSGAAPAGHLTCVRHGTTSRGGTGV
ncbi:hypothetical protein TNCV_2526351 [Trichonephila clavipes]|nr:hypothetical protein TNCV_2526351 [Trichonephila clavipes]